MSNKSINKYMIPVRMICKYAATEYQWGTSFHPILGFKKLSDNNTDEKIFPFTLDEQKKLIEVLPNNWKLYFQFVFCSGLRPGEQIAMVVVKVVY